MITGGGVMLNLEDGSLVLCGAKSKRSPGMACRQPAMANGRCRLHGGKCRGPRTKQGLEIARRANWKHGYYSKEAILERDRIQKMIKSFRCELRGIAF